MNMAAKTKKVYKHIKQNMSIAAKTQKYLKKNINIAMKTNKVYRHIKKTMSIPAKTQRYQKAHEHRSENEQAVQTHQKPHEHSSKNTKRSNNP